MSTTSAPTRPSTFVALSGGALSLGLAAFVLMAPTSAHAQEACGDLEVETVETCTVYQETTCTERCTPESTITVCDLQCHGSCTETETESCRAGCSGECVTTCEEEPTSFECEPVCVEHCDTHCAGHCEASFDEASCSGMCKTSCEEECSLECDEVGVTETCETKCDASCHASCVVTTQTECSVGCTSECSETVVEDCETQCSTENGAVFCEGDQYVNASDVEQCVAELEEREITIEGDFEFGGEVTITDSDGKTTVSCGGAPTSAGAGFLVLVVGFALFLSRRMQA